MTQLEERLNYSGAWELPFEEQKRCFKCTHKTVEQNWMRLNVGKKYMVLSLRIIGQLENKIRLSQCYDGVVSHVIIISVTNCYPIKVIKS